MATKYTRVSYEELKEEVMCSFDSGNLMLENSDQNAEFFVDSIQLFLDKTKKALNSASLVAYPVSCTLFC